MAVMTIRGLDDEMVRSLKGRARREKSSVNSVLLKIVAEALGLKKKKRTPVYDDLDSLAGTWNEEEYLEFQARMADFEKVDEEM